jgi:hypothetical protein
MFDVRCSTFPSSPHAAAEPGFTIPAHLEKLAKEAQTLETDTSRHSRIGARRSCDPPFSSLVSCVLPSWVFCPYSSSLTADLPSLMARPKRSRKYPSIAFRTLSFSTPLRIA